MSGDLAESTHTLPAKFIDVTTIKVRDSSNMALGV